VTRILLSKSEYKTTPSFYLEYVQKKIMNFIIVETLIKYRYGEMQLKIIHIPDLSKDEKHRSMSFWLLLTIII